MGSPQPGGRLGELKRARFWLSRVTAPESNRGRARALVALLALTVLLALGYAYIGVGTFPVLSVIVPVVFGGLLLPPRTAAVVIAAGFVVVVLEDLGIGDGVVHPGQYALLAIVSGIALQQSVDRERLGLSIGRGEQMLIELRDRLQLQGDMPALPPAWHAEVELKSAGGSSFGGDFIVSTLTDCGKTLELALVDVSGKGVEAGTRALMLSGALGGLLGSVPPHRFLEAANSYLLRQEWDEGFATAVHLTIDLTSGKYRVSSAGHPPAVHYAGGSGRWEVVEAEGTVLGLLAGEQFGAVEGELGPYDALLLYTDGLVEVPGRDLALGIDKLLGSAEHLISRGFEGGALRLLNDVAPEATDDRAILLLWRS
ncbi:MAG: serine/threonine-protein phosphatase [Frankiaceae bacterium]|nr:serine/threonine-protein phosphatase [Frankiaceae bacterium]MBV9869854.1 serine/threonine-protein phosphatase [Frankiaceae bacterium]